MQNRLEPLGGGIDVEVSDDFGFGEDALLLAQFAAPRENERVCDLGTGCGILPLLWCRETRTIRIHALELMPEAADMARRSVERCGLSTVVQVICADLRDWRSVLAAGSQDLVTMNPHYFPARSGKASQTESARIARHEGAGCTLDGAAEAAMGLLRTGGRFCLCHRPEQLCHVLAVLREHRLEPKRLRFVQAKADSTPWLLLCEAHKDGNPGLAVLPPFYQRTQDGNETEEQKALYKWYYEQ